MKKKLIYLIATVVGILLAFCGLIGCSKTAPNGGTGGGTGGGGDDPNGDLTKLAAVDVATMNVTETLSGITLKWAAVEGATKYSITCKDQTVSVSDSEASLTDKFGSPPDGTYTLSIIAKSYDKEDSDPTKFTYKVEGVQLRSPVITKYENGILEWAADKRVVEYTVKVDGVAAYRADAKAVTYDTASDKGAHTIEVVANGDGMYFKTSSVSVNINENHTALCLAPITDYKLEDGVISWEPIGGAKGYLVVDLDRSGTFITDSYYEIESVTGYKNLVYGVYPISDNELIRDAEVVSVDMPYLKGKGTASDPYLINTPFELRAIDYYEAVYAEKLAAYNNGKLKNAPAKNTYRIEKDLDYATVAATEESSNIFTLAKPFYGTLDGNNKTIKSMRVHYDGGYWALFDYLVVGSTVKNLTFDEPTINNVMQDEEHPINASVATVAYNNYGTVSGITVKNAHYTAAGGEISGIVSHNYGTVDSCTLSGTFKLADTGLSSQACYEAAGIVSENYGTVKNNKVTTLTIDGDVSCTITYKRDSNNNIIKDSKGNPIVDKIDYYNNARTVAGIVAVNRASGTVSNNGYETLKMTNMLNFYAGTDGGYEFGGVVAYNAGTVVKGSATLGTFTWSTSTKDGVKLASPISKSIVQEIDTTRADLRGKYVGKNDGTI